MEQISYKSIYIKEYLNEIKRNVENNYVKLEGEKVTDVDKKMESIIDELFFAGRSKFEFDKFNNGADETNERIICTLILYYTALYNDNLELLYKLLDSGYNFGKNRYKLNLGMLNKKISSSISYQNLLKYDFLIKSFNNQIYLSSNYKNYKCKIIEFELQDDVIIDRFCYLLEHIDLSMIDDKLSLDGIFSRTNLCYFEIDEILNSTIEQKLNILQFGYYIDNFFEKDELERLKNLMKNYGFLNNYGARIIERLFKELSDDEILKLDAMKINLDDFRLKKSWNIDFDLLRKKLNSDIDTEVNKGNILKRILKRM